MYVILIIPCSLGLGGLAGGWNVAWWSAAWHLRPSSTTGYCIAVLTTLSNCEPDI